MSDQRIVLNTVLAASALFALPALLGQNAPAPQISEEPPGATQPAKSEPKSNESKPEQTTTTTAPSAEKAAPATTTVDATPANAAAGGEPSVDRATQSAQSTSSSAPQPGTSAAMSTDRVTVVRAEKDIEQQSAAKLKGQRLRDSSGAELGKIHDFIVDAESGDLVHVVISTGGVLGVGDKLRLMPAKGLEASAMEGFRTSSTKAQIDALPVISEKDLKAGRFTQAATQDQGAEASSQTATVHSQLVRASQLKDKSIRADDHAVGELEHVIIDLEQGKAFALIDADRGFTREGGKFIVPFKKLQVRSGDDARIASSLLRSDFATQSDKPSGATSHSAAMVAAAPAASNNAAQSASIATTSTDARSDNSQPSAQSVAATEPAASSNQSVAANATPPAAATASTTPNPAPDNPETIAAAERPSATATPEAQAANRGAGTGDTANVARSESTPSKSSPAPSSSDEQLTPTGRTSNDQAPASLVAALAIRQALDSDPELAKQKVEVGTKIILRGTVESDEARKRVEEVVKQAAKDADVENQITVEAK
jgi:sporulation protein YlmC with PRC-barrel domain